MKARGKVIRYGELELVSPYEIQTLQDLNMTQTNDDHAMWSTVFRDFILQYKETDWKNLKWIAAQFETLLVADDLQFGFDIGGMIPMTGGADG